jgi:hypothetical protein
MKRPRFNLRTLAIVMTLICAYFAAWEVTKRYGFPRINVWYQVSDDERAMPSSVRSPIPFIVVTVEVIKYPDPAKAKPSRSRERWYLWLGDKLVRFRDDDWTP